ncbi:MAG TPA: hypothetical protein VH540_02975 [Ktedonobacterales bacterium]|jgi:hypothetical protein
MTDVASRGQLVPRELLLQSEDVLATPRAAQHLQQGELAYSDYVKNLTRDIARGLDRTEWAKELAQEGDCVLARLLAASCDSPDLDLFIKQQQEIWQKRLRKHLQADEEKLAQLPASLTTEEQQSLNQTRKEAESQMSQSAFHLAKLTVQRYSDEVALASERAAQVHQKRRTQALDRVRSAREVYYASSVSQGTNEVLEQARRLLEAAERIALRQALSESDLEWLERYCVAATLLCEDPTSNATRELLEALSAAPTSRSELFPTPPFATASSSKESITPVHLPSPHAEPASQEARVDLSAQFPAPEGGWSATHDGYLADYYLSYTDEDLARHLGVPMDSVQARIQTLGLVGFRSAGVRAPRGRELRQEFWSNPYIPGKPITTLKMFFGRERDLEYIRSNLSHDEGESQGRVIILEGHRRTGKTSLLHHLEGKKSAPSILAPRIPIYLPIDSYIPFTSAKLFHKMSYSIYQALHRLEYPIAQPVWADFQSDFGMAWHRYLEEAAEATGGTGLVLMFDEFQIIEERRAAGNLDRDVYWVLRADIQEARQIDFILAGTMRLEDIVRQHDAALFNIGPVRILRSLDDNNTRLLIRDPVREQKISYDEDAVELILALTSSYPYYVQLLCSVLFNYLNDRQKKRAMRGDVERIVPTVLEEGATQFTSILFANDVSSLERYILAGAAEQITTLGGPCSREQLFTLLAEKKLVASETDFEQGLRQLVFRDLLKDGGGEHIAFQVDLFRQWMSTQKKLERVIREERERDQHRRT